MKVKVVLERLAAGLELVTWLAFCVCAWGVGKTLDLVVAKYTGQQGSTALAGFLITGGALWMMNERRKSEALREGRLRSSAHEAPAQPPARLS